MIFFSTIELLKTFFLYCGSTIEDINVCYKENLKTLMLSANNVFIITKSFFYEGSGHLY